ncbi:MAG: hypothetical protein L3J41_05605 [Melioribacteraceae bacterium]|nr:hypothetical protein [Melioribacteraceae bacterium]
MKTNVKVISLFLLLSQVLFSGDVFSQWNFSLSTNQEFNSNPFRSVTSGSDFISTYELGIEKEFNGFNILYYGSYNTFRTAVDIDYYWHQGGIYSRTENRIIGTYFEQRINKEANNYFDYQNYAAYAKNTFSFLSLKWNTGINLNYMNYSNLSDFNNWIVSANIRSSKSFQTKTTLIGAFTFNYKGFKDFSSYTDSLNEGNTTQNNSGNVNVSQIEFNGRVAQSIFDNTGLALNFNAKKIISGSGFGASLFESTYGDMELYDDPISQEGFSVGAMLTQVFSNDIVFKLRYFYFYKSYPSQGIYHSETEYDKNISRLDNQSQLSSTLTKTFLIGSSSESAIHLSLNIFLINNNSNSYYYNYKNDLFSISLNYQF